MSSSGTATRSRRRFGSATDMLRSLLVVFAFVLVIYWLTPRPDSDPVREIDYAGPLQRAVAAAPFAVQAPEGLPDGWRATSARTERTPSDALAWHLGFVTPTGGYAAVSQSTEPLDALAARVGAGPRQEGQVELAGATWQRRSVEDREERALLRAAADSVVAVDGSASWAELEQLAAALRPQPRR